MEPMLYQVSPPSFSIPCFLCSSAGTSASSWKLL
jgi:hypothetical protein